MSETCEQGDVQTLVQSIRRERRYGVVHCVVHGSSGIEPTAQSLDAFVCRSGMKGIGEDWIEVPYADAIEHLAAILYRDMAYNCEIMPRGRAVELAARFLNLFPAGRFFTNTEDGPHDPPRSGTWVWGSNPVTDATFDTGVVAVAQERIGLLWVEDED